MPVNGAILKPIITAGTADIAGPMFGTISKRPAKTASGRAYLTPNKLSPIYVNTPTTVIRIISPQNHEAILLSAIEKILTAFSACFFERNLCKTELIVSSSIKKYRLKKSVATTNKVFEKIDDKTPKRLLVMFGTTEDKLFKSM